MMERLTIDEAILLERETVRRNKMMLELNKLMQESHAVCFDKLKRETSIRIHEQLAEWLEELKCYKNDNDFSGYADRLHKIAFNSGYDKAIDDFAGRLIRYVDCGHLCSPTEMRWSDLTVVEMVKKLAEQLKAGDKKNDL